MYVAVAFVLLFLNWMFFSGKFDPFHLTLGAISCLLVACTSADLLFRDRAKGLGARLAEAGRFLGYCGWLLWQIVVANFHVFSLAMFYRRRQRELDPHLLTFKTTLATEFARFVLANSITLTPGTVTVRVEDDVFLVHAVSRQAAGDLATSAGINEMERRVAAVFEPARSSQ
ncbi:MAG: Na+/H+ antiporter subunit E [Thermodesulfobacteriota bacterium]